MALQRTRATLALVSAAALVLTSACSKEEGGTPSQSDSAPSGQRRSSDERERSTPRVAPEDRKDIDPTETGSIQGVVLYTKDAPARKMINMAGAGGCGDHEVPAENLIVNDGKLQNVIVWVRRGLEAWNVPAAPSEPAMLDQRGCVYQPHVLAIQLGQKILVRNSDQVTHNVHPTPRKNENFNNTQIANAADIEWVLSDAEVPVPVGCDIHPWMKAWVGVVDHPFFAVSDSEGAFTIEGLPPGEYELEAWHEPRTRKKLTVTVTAGEATSAELQFP